MIAKDGAVTRIDLAETANDEEIEVTVRRGANDDFCVLVTRATLTQISDLLAAFLCTAPARVLH
jgi:hypothetical protein